MSSSKWNENLGKAKNALDHAYSKSKSSSSAALCDSSCSSSQDEASSEICIPACHALHNCRQKPFESISNVTYSECVQATMLVSNHGDTLLCHGGATAANGSGGNNNGMDGIYLRFGRVCRLRFWKVILIALVVLVGWMHSKILWPEHHKPKAPITPLYPPRKSKSPQGDGNLSNSTWSRSTNNSLNSTSVSRRPYANSNTSRENGTSASRLANVKEKSDVNVTESNDTVDTDARTRNVTKALHHTQRNNSTKNYVVYNEHKNLSRNDISGGPTSNSTDKVLHSREKPLCPPVPPKLVGALKIVRQVPTLEEQEKSHPELELGGRFRPHHCRARHRVAVIVPFRDRASHLALFTYHLHPMLERQQIDYAIYIIEQAGSGRFNRAMLLNVGALEALKQYQYDCFIFHDVDLLPEDDRNLYTCPEQPRHMSIAIDVMGYKLPYNDIFGGVSAMTTEQLQTVNGFSNKFWGWGGEDDDMSNRIKFHGFFISRYPANIARYVMLSHKKNEPNPKRYAYLYEGKKRFKSDGLNSVKYHVLDIQFRRLYTWVYVDLLPS
ncbi:beta-1,4-galactosyltransferase 1-like isoform X2 [Oratosquilla oratoria]|uniref:beta-1,4-galactosyltransferase 1-like isoform X2 n=1 Tax=Oratosquilla oratoria TaxID=337810 RepID=UPI003F763EA2